MVQGLTLRSPPTASRVPALSLTCSNMESPSRSPPRTPGAWTRTSCTSGEACLPTLGAHPEPTPCHLLLSVTGAPGLGDLALPGAVGDFFEEVAVKTLRMGRAGAGAWNSVEARGLAWAWACTPEPEGTVRALPCSPRLSQPTGVAECSRQGRQPVFWQRGKGRPDLWAHSGLGGGGVPGGGVPPLSPRLPSLPTATRLESWRTPR